MPPFLSPLVPRSQQAQVETAALMYQTVMRSPSLALFYGDDDLTFIREIKNPRVILALVKQVNAWGPRVRVCLGA
jgi:hypothetical protein